jgi:hypothetical protein
MAWLADGIARAVRRGDRLDASLGLAAPGQDSMQRKLLAILRNGFLVDAISSVAIDARISEWSRCKRLAPLLRHFVADVWPRVRMLSGPPCDWPTWKRSTFYAAQTDLDLPTSVRGLHDIVKSTRLYSSHRRAATLLTHLLQPTEHAPSGNRDLRTHR